MGAVLSQLDEEGVEHPMCYASRSCNPAEQNYSSFDGECLAVVWATNHFRAYLFGNSFTLVTDHEPLRWLMTTQKLTGKMARWSLLLQEYNFTVQHRAGVDNTNVDCLRRLPLKSKENVHQVGGADPTTLQIIQRCTLGASRWGAEPLWSPRRDRDRPRTGIPRGVPNPPLSA